MPATKYPAPKHMPSDKDAKKMFKKLLEQGCEIRDKKNGWLILLPNGETIGWHRTPSGYKSTMPNIAAMKRAGIRL